MPALVSAGCINAYRRFRVWLVWSLDCTWQRLLLFGSRMTSLNLANDRPPCGIKAVALLSGAALHCEVIAMRCVVIAALHVWRDIGVYGKRAVWKGVWIAGLYAYRQLKCASTSGCNSHLASSVRLAHAIDARAAALHYLHCKGLGGILKLA